MHGYKVIFDNNIAQYAYRLDIVDNEKILKISKEGNHRYMDWLVVCGNSEHDAMWMGNKFLRTFWADYLK